MCSSDLKRPFINLCFTENEENIEEFSPYLKKWINKVNSISRNKTFGKEEGNKYSSDSYNEPERGYCTPMHTDIFISSRGEMFNCHQDVLLNKAIPLNFKDTTVMDAYNSDMLNNRRLQHLNGEYPKDCTDCLEFAVCKESIEKENGMYVKTMAYHKLYQL